MTSEKFRQQLRQEAKKWRDENFIDESLYQQLAQRYEFSQLDDSAKNRFIMVLIGVGSILLGLAVITFVAANWDALTKELKVIILLSFFILINTVGFYLWSNYQENLQHRFGSGLLIFGTLILGANLGLMSQLFHQSGSVHELYLVWAIAVVIMAYSLKMNVLGIVSIILLQIAYFLRVGFSYNIQVKSDILETIINYLPVLLSLVFIPLAYRCKSKWLFGITTFLIVESYGTNFSLKGSDLVNSSRIIASFLAINYACFVPAFLWAYRDNLWTKKEYKFEKIARSLAVFFLCILFYILSFRIWNDRPNFSSHTWIISDYLIFIEPVLLILLTLLAWWKLRVSKNEDSYHNANMFWGFDLTSILIIVLLSFTGFLLTFHLAIAPIGYQGVLFFNIFLALLSIGLIRESLAEGKRFRFWSAIILIVLQIFTRMMEYDTDLLFKAFVLLLCGISIIMAGIWFEKNIRVLDS